MLSKVSRWAMLPAAVAVVAAALVATPASAITGPNITEDFEHEYVGLVAFYDADGEFVHRCTGTLLSPEVFLTAGHCVTVDDEGTLAASARIWFEQDAGADYDPVTDTPASSGYPYTGGVTSTMLYNYGFTDLSTIPDTHDAGLIVLEPGAVEAVYPDIDTYGSLAPIGTADELGTGVDAVVTVSGYGLTSTKGKNGVNVVSFRERLMGQAFIVNGRNPDSAGFNLKISANFGSGRVGTCFGDSGGPTFAGDSDTVIAVTSWGKDPSCGGPGFQFRVDTAPVQEWMESVLAPLGLWSDIAPE